MSGTSAFASGPADYKTVLAKAPATIAETDLLKYDTKTFIVDRSKVDDWFMAITFTETVDGSEVKYEVLYSKKNGETTWKKIEVAPTQHMGGCSISEVECTKEKSGAYYTNVYFKETETNDEIFVPYDMNRKACGKECRIKN